MFDRPWVKHGLAYDWIKAIARALRMIENKVRTRSYEVEITEVMRPIFDDLECDRMAKII